MDANCIALLCLKRMPRPLPPPGFCTSSLTSPAITQSLTSAWDETSLLP